MSTLRSLELERFKKTCKWIIELALTPAQKHMLMTILAYQVTGQGEVEEKELAYGAGYIRTKYAWSVLGKLRELGYVKVQAKRISENSVILNCQLQVGFDDMESQQVQSN